MTNEELIDYQMCQMCNQRCNCINDKRDRCTPYEEVVELLKEKDQQFKEHLEKKMEKFMKTAHAKGKNPYDYGYIDAINEIINELFKGE